MSVLIKGMEMPKSCFECPIVRDCRGAASYRRIGIDEDCPLVEVQTPHGRIIDAVRIKMQIDSAKEAAINENKNFANGFRDADGELATQWWVVEDMLENTPAIIEAEE